MKRLIVAVLILICMLGLVSCAADNAQKDDLAIEQVEEIRCPDCGFFLGRRSEGYCPQCEKEIK